jgi:hypothetical protein
MILFQVLCLLMWQSHWTAYDSQCYMNQQNHEALMLEKLVATRTMLIVVLEIAC